MSGQVKNHKPDDKIADEQFERLKAYVDVEDVFTSKMDDDLDEKEAQERIRC